MAEYSGSAFYMTWITTSGTTVLTSDYLKFNYDPSVETKEKTNGADAYKTYLATVKDGKFNITMKMQSKGTALTNACAEGTEGTAVISPEGTAATYPKYIIPAISLGVKYNSSFDDLPEVSIDFQQNGARIDSEW
jgi:hypothetical protein